MTTATLAGLSTFSLIAARFAAFSAQRRDAAARRKVYKRTLGELRALSHRELLDIGLLYCDLEAVARDAAYGDTRSA